MMTLTSAQIRNAIAILRSIERHELDAAGFTPTDGEWVAFRDDPYRFYLRAGTSQREAITRIVNARMPANV